MTKQNYPKVIKQAHDGIVAYRTWFKRIAKFERISRAAYRVTMTNGLVFRIEGGRHAGGSSRDWFVDSDRWNGSIHCTSIADALRMLENS